MAISGASPDIELLFGMLGGGDVSGSSGVLIRNQLNQLVASLNNAKYANERRVRVVLDSQTTKTTLRAQLQTVVNDLSQTNSFRVKIAKIDASSAISDLRSQINSALKMLRVDTGFDVNVNADGNISAVKQIAEDAAAATEKAARLKAVIAELERSSGTAKGAYTSAMASLGGDMATGDDVAKVEALRNKFIELQTAMNVVRDKQKSGVLISEEELAQTRALSLEVQQLARDYASVTANKSGANTGSNAKAEMDQYADSLRKANELLSKVTTAQKSWSSAASGKSSKAYSDIEKYSISLNKAIADLKSGAITVDDFNSKVASIGTGFKKASAEIKGAGEATKSLGDRLKGVASRFSAWFGISQIVIYALRAIRQMVTAVHDLDDAMTELKKVTDETSTTYRQFFEDAATRAKELGAALSDVITATADFARLGYSIEDAAQLADAAIVYKNVGDGIESISDASESVISTMQAFGVEAENAMSIVDKFNEVGNRFAISSKGVGDALLRSASALEAANNTLDESIALVTAANTVVQDPEKVGTAIKTVSMYLRAAKTEAEEAGESTDGMANSVSELRKEILALTNNRVDIQIDED